MRHLILAGLPLMIMATIATPAVQAQATPEAPPANAEVIGMAVTPFNLVFLAYQGFFESEGIPKFNRLISSYQSGQVTAESLVRVAISMRRLPPETLNNRAYLNSVQQQLMSLYGSDSD